MNDDYAEGYGAGRKQGFRLGIMAMRVRLVREAAILALSTFACGVVVGLVLATVVK